MNAQAILFLVLVLNQFAATSSFIAVYRRESGWRRTAVGRHLMYWSVAYAASDASWALLLLVKRPWMVVVLFTVMAVVGVLGWQRFVLVWRAQHPPGQRRAERQR